MLCNWTFPPGLAHTQDHAHDAKAKGQDGGDSEWLFCTVFVVLGPVPREAALEDEMIRQNDALVDGQPIRNQIHEILQSGLELAVARDGDGDVDGSGESRPEEARDVSSPPTQHHESERNRVDVWAVVGDDGQSQDDDTEFAEPTKALEQHGAKQTADASVFISSLVGIVATVQRSSGHDSGTEDFCEKESRVDSEPSSEEDVTLGSVARLIHRVVGGEGSVASSEAKDC